MSATVLHGIAHEVADKIANRWVLLGLVGQFIFASRFLIQWIASERKRESIIPLSFWYLSIVGSAILLAYAIHIADPVFIVANLFTGIIYVRNLMLIGRHRQAGRAG